MNPFRCLLLLACGASLASPLSAAVPSLLNYQGRLAVGGTNFEGAGRFKFALVGPRANPGRPATATASIFPLGGVILSLTITDGGAGYLSPPTVTFHHPAGSGALVEAMLTDGAVTGFIYRSVGSNYTSTVTVSIEPPPATVTETAWSNDGSSVRGAEPVQAVTLPVQRGLYSVLLGDPTLSNMTALSPSAFTNAETYLRVWFSDGVAGFEPLVPDQRVAAVAFAMIAAQVPAGAITATHLAAGAVTPAKLAPGSVGSGALSVGAVGTTQIQDATIMDADLSPLADIDAAKIGHGDLQATRLKVGSNHTLATSGQLATIAGGEGHLATAAYATISGGRGHRVTASHGFVGGGLNNVVSNAYASVSGGRDNQGTALYATVGGGYQNAASGFYATIGGGSLNAANQYATVPGGYNNLAAGAYSLAAGRRALAGHEGSFVWADSTDATISSTGTNQFIVRAGGGIWLGTHSAATVTNGFLNTSTGAYLSSGGAWTDNCDRDAKENFTPVNAREILDKVAALPITQWNYRTEAGEVRHIGPVAQDFHAAFGTGRDDRHLAALDSAGVALAAIQGLRAELQTKDTRIAALEQAMWELREQLAHVRGLANERRAGDGVRTDGDVQPSR